MLFAGIFMLFVSIAFPMVTLILDTTPPVFGAVIPANGATYQSLVDIYVGVTDVESGVASVRAGIDGVGYDLALVTGTIYDGMWWKSIPAVAEGSHTMVFTAINKVGLSTVYTGSFKIYTSLQGTWYVNNVAIASPTQTVYSSSLTIPFKFVKTTGIADTSITCTVVKGIQTILTLTNTAANTWTGSYTFANGKHTLDLKASDGTETVTMSVIGFQVGPEGFQLPRVNTLQILGLASAGIGVVLIFTGKKH